MARVSAALVASLGDIHAEALHLRKVATILESAPLKALEPIRRDLAAGNDPIRAAIRARARKRKEDDG
jgi:hypothetical protein